MAQARADARHHRAGPLRHDLPARDGAMHLSKAWPGCRLKMIPVAGHALSEPGISAELVRVMDALRRE